MPSKKKTPPAVATPPAPPNASAVADADADAVPAPLPKPKKKSAAQASSAATSTKKTAAATAAGSAKSKKPAPLAASLSDAAAAAAEPMLQQQLATPSNKVRVRRVVSKASAVETAPTMNTNVVLNFKCSLHDLHNYNETLNRMLMNNLHYNSSAPPEVKNYEETSQPFTAFDPSSGASPPPSSLSMAVGAAEAAAPLIAGGSVQFSSASAPSPPNNGSMLSGLSLCGVSSAGSSSSSMNASLLTPGSAGGQGHCACCALSHARGAPSATDNGFAVDALTAAQEGTPLEEPVSLANNKELLVKLKQLKVQLHTNTLQIEKKSACFWCTCDFDNLPCYIPIYEIEGVIYGYGSFCRPECAVGYLMKENIDDSTKFERYNLLNQIYGKSCGYKKNIKPAPDPHYLLEKFYGNMTIQEYRKLLKTEHLLMVIEKPFTRTLPELHEEFDETFTRIYGAKRGNGTNVSGVYKVKHQSEQSTGPSKASIVRNVFGLPTK
jgi:hypothetical protein